MTHSELAAKLLRDAAALFRSVGGRDSEATQRIEAFADFYEAAADLVEHDPNGRLETQDNT